MVFMPPCRAGESGCGRVVWCRAYVGFLSRWRRGVKALNGPLNSELTYPVYATPLNRAMVPTRVQSTVLRLPNWKRHLVQTKIGMFGGVVFRKVMGGAGLFGQYTFANFLFYKVSTSGATDEKGHCAVTIHQRSFMVVLYQIIH